jgi:2'-5' RNA ligase
VRWRDRQRQMDKRRLFFAFWPDESLRGALEAARNRLFPLSGRPVGAAGLHVTAAFLGAVSDTRLGALQALCGPVPPLTITLDRLEHWPKPRVLVAATTHVPDNVRLLVDGLWQRLDRLGFAREPRPFRPHVTLARDVRSVRSGLPWTPFHWPVNRVSLVESVSTPDGVVYQPIAGGEPAG